MDYDNDAYRDEDGEPLMDYDDGPSDGESQEQNRDNELFDDDEWDEHDQVGPKSLAYDADKTGRPRKRLVKNSDSVGGDEDSFVVPELIDEEEEEEFDEDIQNDNLVETKKMKRVGKGGSSSSDGKERKRPRRGEKDGSWLESGETKKNKYSAKLTEKDDGEVKEMWDTIAGADSEDDQEGPRTFDDDHFIDDSGIDPADRYGSDNERHSPSHAPQAEEGEEDAEINELLKVSKKKKKTEKSPAEIALLVEQIMAELEVTAEEDADLNRSGRPAVNKLKKLPLLTEVLSKKQLQQEFIDHGVLTLLKNWLEPLPDGSLPNINIREAILNILSDLPIDLEQHDRRDLMKRSGLGKVIMFLSKTDEETTSNRKLARELVDKWSRPIFNKSTRFEDMRHYDDERAFRRPPIRKKMNNVEEIGSADGDLDLDISRQRLTGQTSARLHASRPEATPLDFVVRPHSKVDPESIRARAKQVVQDQRRLKMNKKLQQLKGPKKKPLQATKLSVEGRGMLKYLG